MGGVCRRTSTLARVGWVLASASVSFDFGWEPHLRCAHPRPCEHVAPVLADLDVEAKRARGTAAAVDGAELATEAVVRVGISRG